MADVREHVPAELARGLDHPVAREGERRSHPGNERAHRIPQQDKHAGGERDPQHRGPGGAVVGRVDQSEDPPHDDEHRHEDRSDERDPVRTKIQHELFAFDEQPSGERHRAGAYCRCSTSPNRTRSTASPTRTTSAPVSSTSTASPSTTFPPVVCARIRVPSVEQTPRYDATTSCPNDSFDGRYPRANPWRNAVNRSSASASTAAAFGTSLGGDPRLTPIPTTMNSTLDTATRASARIPPALPPFTRTSFGHLHVASAAATSRHAVVKAVPASNEMVPIESGSSGGRRTSENNRACPGWSVHVRPRRPPPAVWWVAATSVHSGAPSIAIRTAVAWVEPVTSSNRTGACSPARSSARESACSESISEV